MTGTTGTAGTHTATGAGTTLGTDTAAGTTRGITDTDTAWAGMTLGTLQAGTVRTTAGMTLGITATDGLLLHSLTTASRTTTSITVTGTPHLHTMQLPAEEEAAIPEIWPM